MPLLSCSVFLDKIESGAKTRTIRSPRKYPIKPNDHLYLWWKSRTTERRKLGETTCLQVTPIVMGEDFVQLSSTKIIDPEFLEEFAKLDGFESWAEMKDYFRPRFGRELHLIEWKYPFFYQLNDLVSYGGFASTISVFEVTRIRGFSDCGQFVYLNWVRHPVPVSDIRPAVDKGNFWDKYSEVLENDQSGDSI